MSLYGVLQTGVSGMNAQANKLGTVADNIANANTSGYKRATAEFASLVMGADTGSYQSGAVETRIRRHVSERGEVTFTTSTTDLAVEGRGFFVVADNADGRFLTRAGSFVADSTGDLVNGAGFKLQGVPLTGGGGTAPANSLSGLQTVNVGQLALTARPSTEGSLSANLPSATAPAAVGGSTSMVLYDNLGAQQLVNVTFTKTAAAGGWTATATDASGAPLGTATLTYDMTTGNLTAASPTALTFTVPGGQPFTLDLSTTTQLATGYSLQKVQADGTAPSKLKGLSVDAQGILSATYESGQVLSLFRIPLADVPTPDELTPLSGNVYSINIKSGNPTVGSAGTSGFGTMKSGALEMSNVDIADELTKMIESQRNYTANTKVFQTGADLLNELVNLKR